MERDGFFLPLGADLDPKGRKKGGEKILSFKKLLEHCWSTKIKTNF